MIYEHYKDEDTNAFFIFGSMVCIFKKIESYDHYLGELYNEEYIDYLSEFGCMERYLVRSLEEYHYNHAWTFYEIKE